MSLSVLSVAYPFAQVSPDAVGGAEQILNHLDAALVRAGHRSVVVAAKGSQVAGELAAVPLTGGPLDPHARAKGQALCAAAIRDVLARQDVDLVHMHGIDFHAYLPPPGPPVLATLHLPPDWYPPEIYALARPDIWLNCVSASQRRACPHSPLIAATIDNGVPVEALAMPARKRRFAVSLGRICPEKGFHFALDAAARADMPFRLAGQLYAYAEHERYFADEIAPRLSAKRRFLGPVGFARKRRLLSAAQCLVVPSQAPETSCLVAMEALACGTPVVAFPVGALPDVVEHGRTGFLVEGVAEMAGALDAAAGLSPDACRRAARERFSAARMAERYLDLYRRLARRAPASGAA